MYSYSKDPTRLAALAAPSFLASARDALLRAAAWLRGSRLGTAAARLIVERHTRLAIDELRAWDDHMLRDIGLQRMDIEGAVRGEFRPLPRDAEPAPRPLQRR
jgi:uncharacterized protein YjiS (DUF1127 family)